MTTIQAATKVDSGHVLPAEPSPKELPQLPSHILDDIVNLLPPPALASCARVSTLWYEHIQPKLYKRIVIREGKYCPEFRERGPTLERLCPNPTSHTTVIEVYPYLDSLSLSLPGGYFRSGASSSNFAKLETLRINSTGRTAGQVLVPLFPNCLNIHPRTLVARDAPLLYDVVPRELNRLSGVKRAFFTFLPDVALVGSNRKWETHGSAATGILFALPPDVEDLTIVFDAPKGGRWRPQPRPEDMPPKPGLEEPAYIETTWVGRFLFSDRGLLHALKSKVPKLRSLTFVNMESVDPVAVIEGPRADTVHSTTEEVRQVLDDALRHHSNKLCEWRFEEPAAWAGSQEEEEEKVKGEPRPSRIRNMSMREWLEVDSAWRDVYDYEEIKEWLA